MTSVDSEIRHDDFKARRQAFPKDSFPRRQIIRISDEQFAAINQVFERQYIDKLAQNMQFWAGIYGDEKDFRPFAGELFCYLQEQGIDTQYQIESIAEQLIKQRVDSFADIPAHILKTLSYDGSPGWFRANKAIQGLAKQGTDNE